MSYNRHIINKHYPNENVNIRLVANQAHVLDRGSTSDQALTAIRTYLLALRDDSPRYLI